MRRALVALTLLAAGCEEEDPSSAQDTDAETTSTESGDSGSETGLGEIECADQPVITYTTFGRGFLSSYCDGCHAAAVMDRQGAPEGVSFDSAEQATMYTDRILARLLPEEPLTPMPPAGGVVPSDLDRARIWLTCYP